MRIVGILRIVPDHPRQQRPHGEIEIAQDAHEQQIVLEAIAATALGKQLALEARLIEPHRLAALILEDLKRYPESAIGDIRQRIGSEIYPRQVKRALDGLIDKGEVRFEGDKRWRRYWAAS